MLLQIEAALLIETGLHRVSRAVIVVTAPVESQITRVCMRDHVDRESAMRTIAAQLPSETRSKHATALVPNDAGVTELHVRTKEALALCVSRM